MNRRRGGIVPQLAQTVDIFNGDDAVIHQHTDAERQPRKGDDIEGDAGKIHKHHRKKQTDGDAERHDDGGTEIPQEKQQDGGGKQRAEQEVLQNRADDKVDVLALVAQGGKVQPLVFFLQPFHGVVEVPAGAGGGGHRGLLHGEQHPVIAVDFGIKLLGIIGQPHIGDIRKTDLPHVPHRIIEQHPVFQLLQVGEFIPDLEGEPAVGALDIAGGHGEILRHEKLRNGGLGQDAVQPGGLVGGVPLLTELLLCFIESLLRLLQLHRGQN